MRGSAEHTFKMEICSFCQNKEECHGICAAMIKLANVIQIKDQENKIELLSMMKADILDDYTEESKEYEILGNQIIDKFDQFSFIRDYEITIAYVLSYERKQHNKKLIFGKCEKVSKEFKAFLPYDFVITIYEPNADLLNENQRKILLKHELMHIGIGRNGLKIEDHTINDFYSLVAEYGYNWNDWLEDGVEVPDILGGDD